MSWNPAEIKQLNSIVQRWQKNTKRQLKYKAKGTKFGQHLRTKNYYDHGVIESAGFEFYRYGVFYHHGVFGGKTKEELSAEGKLRPRPWYSETMNTKLPALETELLDFLQDRIELNLSRIDIINNE